MKDLAPVEKITSKIYLIRGQKVMLDRDLSELYWILVALECFKMSGLAYNPRHFV
jgi:hypothetical protein